MKLQLERKTVEALSEQFTRLTTLREQLRFDNKAEAAFSLFTNRHERLSARPRS